jgi:hypothetical protein
LTRVTPGEIFEFPPFSGFPGLVGIRDLGIVVFFLADVEKVEIFGQGWRVFQVEYLLGQRGIFHSKMLIRDSSLLQD